MVGAIMWGDAEERKGGCASHIEAGNMVDNYEVYSKVSMLIGAKLKTRTLKRKENPKMNPRKSCRRRNGPIPTTDSSATIETNRGIITPSPPRLKIAPRGDDRASKTWWEAIGDAGLSISDGISKITMPMLVALLIISIMAPLLDRLWNGWISAMET
ncbi:hypothetical protein V490_06759 [Pseudogymnoascus sp. VKM F-3557]|nr:hypothetical protein V490_06759 [Pseudogymnoascus sp. VKM F-3557]